MVSTLEILFFLVDGVLTSVPCFYLLSFSRSGAAYANMGRLADAQKEFEHALRLDPSHPNAGKYLQAINLRVSLFLSVARAAMAPISNVLTALRFVVCADAKCSVSRWEFGCRIFVAWETEKKTQRNQT